MTARILHVSDLHTGTREDPQVEQALAAHDRVALHLTPGLDPAVSAVPGMPVSLRAHAEPALNAWLAGVLPDPGTVKNGLVPRLWYLMPGSEAAGILAGMEASPE